MRLRETAAFLTVEAAVSIAVLGLASIMAIHQEATVWPLRHSGGPSHLGDGPCPTVEPAVRSGCVTGDW